jgi:hypothetical protein
MGLKRKNPARIRLFTLGDAAAFMVTTAPEARPSAALQRVSSDERRRRIAHAAYGRAERAGFVGDPVEDWLAAEREVDASLRCG